MKLLYLTMYRRVLNEEAQKRLDDYEDEDYIEVRDEHGRTSEWYEEAGIPIPPDLLRREKEMNKGLEFEDADYDDVYAECAIRPEEITMFTGTADGDSVVYLKNGTYVNVEEDTDEIGAQLWWLNRNWWEKLKEQVTIIKNKFKTNK